MTYLEKKIENFLERSTFHFWINFIGKDSLIVKKHFRMLRMVQHWIYSDYCGYLDDTNIAHQGFESIRPCLSHRQQEQASRSPRVMAP